MPFDNPVFVEWIAKCEYFVLSALLSIQPTRRQYPYCVLSTKKARGERELLLRKKKATPAAATSVTTASRA
jgi:uncharacterized membrane protein